MAAFFGVTAQLIFKNDGNMYRIPLGGRGAATAKRLEYNRQNGGKLKIEAKNVFCCFYIRLLKFGRLCDIIFSQMRTRDVLTEFIGGIYHVRENS